MRKLIHWNHDPYNAVRMTDRDVSGWSSDSPIFNEVLLEIKPKLIIEVGSWFGRSAINMAKIMLEQNITDFEIVCIDTWLGSVEHWQNDGSFKYGMKNGRPTIYDKFLSNVIHENLIDYITPFPIDSLNGAEFLERNKVEADLIYIDAGHEYLSVKMDLYAYSKLLRPGGYLLGDDWFHEPIKKAAKELFNDKIIEKSVDKFLWIR